MASRVGIVLAAVVARFVDGDRRTDMDHGNRSFTVLGTPGSDPLAHAEIVEFVPAGCEDEQRPVGESLDEIEEHGDPGALLTGAAEPAGERRRDQQRWAPRSLRASRLVVSAGSIHASRRSRTCRRR